MKTLVLLITLSLTFTSYAGPGGGHSHGHGQGTPVKKANIGAKEAEKLARNKVRVLAFQEKINTSWNEAKLATAELKDIKGKKEWALTFTNDKGVKGKKLFVFLKSSGEFVAANFTGK